MEFLDECCVRRFNDLLEEICSYVSLDRELTYVKEEYQCCFKRYIEDLSRFENANEMLDMCIENLKDETLPTTLSAFAVMISIISVINSNVDNMGIIDSLVFAISFGIAFLGCVFLLIFSLKRNKKIKKYTYIKKILENKETV